MPQSSSITSRRQAKPSKQSLGSLQQYTLLDAAEALRTASAFADHIEANFEMIADVLLSYESFEVVEDETARTLDLLRNLDENKGYFSLRCGQVTAFLPRNQPLYALSCFVLVPALMATEVHMRIPFSMRHFFPELLKALRVNEFFPNVKVSSKERLQFLEERSALYLNEQTQETLPVTDAVIFTGTSEHAEKLRLVFDQRTLFIANGSGHNPVVVSSDADISQAVDAALTLQLYNQGQDCAAPNAILVHAKAYDRFLETLRTRLKEVKVGQYRDRACRVGPISDPEDLVRIQALLIENRGGLDEQTPGIVRAKESIVEPTIICKPLSMGANFREVFAPVLFVQSYDRDEDLALYFESPQYARNAMYVSVYGTSKYVNALTEHRADGKMIHDEASILRNAHLHEHGRERGTQPYGGYGYAASSFSIHGKISCLPTLPQREIYEQVAKPLLISERQRELRRRTLQNMNTLLHKDVRKILGLKSAQAHEKNAHVKSERQYVDVMDILAAEGQRYILVEPEKLFPLLSSPNVEFLASMDVKHVRHVRDLRNFLQKRKKIATEELKQFLYAVAKKPEYSERQNRTEQLEFFRCVYRLLLGKDSGPRLTQFLCDVDRKTVLELLNV